jgi:hypothetical protein
MASNKRGAPVRKCQVLQIRGAVLGCVSMEQKPYCKLGEVLDEQSRARHVHGPYNIAKHVREATGFEVSGSSVSGYFYGRTRPPLEFNAAFVEAFSLEEDEIERLAYVYTLGKEPPPR